MKQKTTKTARGKLTKNMLISDVVTKFPELTDYILDYGVHCIGCGAAMFETLEQGFAAHGMKPKDIDKAVEDMNKVLQKK